jgi:ATPase subunit of ABC transporter with duplicated ATPase domains
MILTVDLLGMVRTKISEVDRKLALRYGDRYDKIKHQFKGAKKWYQTKKSEAQNSNTIPLEQKQEETTDRFAKAGSTAARQEEVVKQKLKKMWDTRPKG